MRLAEILADPFNATCVIFANAGMSIVLWTKTIDSIVATITGILVAIAAVFTIYGQIMKIKRMKQEILEMKIRVEKEEEK